jgi:Protein of unknown function (DUF1493)
MEVKLTNFKTLRNAYLEVQKFLEEETFTKVKSLDFKIEEHGRIAGDDIKEMMYKFSQKYNIDFQHFDFHKHFQSEGEIINPYILIFNLIHFSFYKLKTLYYLILKHKNTLKPYKSPYYREVLDLTFGDLVTCFIEKKFTYRNQLKYVI